MMFVGVAIPPRNGEGNQPKVGGGAPATSESLSAGAPPPRRYASRSPSPCRGGSSGFTLVELIIALFIFGVISAASVSLLAFTVDTQEASGEALADMNAIRRMNVSLTTDLGQIAPRAARDQAGSRQLAFRGGDGSGGDILFSFVRRGWSNYDDAPRSSLQKVDYLLSDGELQRRAYPFVDGAEPLPAATLVQGVEGVSIRYRHDGEMRERWDPERESMLPDAVELVVVIEGLGPVRQLIQVGGGA